MSQAILVGIMLVGSLGVEESTGEELNIGLSIMSMIGLTRCYLSRSIICFTGEQLGPARTRTGSDTRCAADGSGCPGDHQI